MKHAFDYGQHLAVCRESVWFRNEGTRILNTDYFGTVSARQGTLYGSWNAGALRILIPDSRLEEMMDVLSITKQAEVTQGEFALEIVFNNGALDVGFASIHIDFVDHELGPESEGEPIQVFAYSSQGQLGWGWPGTFHLGQVPSQRVIQGRANVAQGGVA